VSALLPIFDATLDGVVADGAALEGRIAVPNGGGEYTLLVLMSLFNGFAEQLVIAGFLVPRLTTLLGHPAKAVLCAAALFGSYHIYQGAMNASAIFLTGLLMGGVFAVTRRLWPLALAHACMDVVAFAMYALE
jgi:membrane protease YdiL (CAAX protease family)